MCCHENCMGPIGLLDDMELSLKAHSRAMEMLGTAQVPSRAHAVDSFYEEVIMVHAENGELCDLHRIWYRSEYDRIFGEVFPTRD